MRECDWWLELEEEAPPPPPAVTLASKDTPNASKPAVTLASTFQLDSELSSTPVSKEKDISRSFDPELV